MKMIKILKLTFILAFILQIGGAIILAGAPQAANAQLFKVNTTPLQFQPQVKIPSSEFEKDTVPVGTYVAGKTTSDLLAKYIKAFYNYGLAVAGILAAIVLMAGGVLWLTSAGNDAKVTQAKELISGSVIGAVILFGSWIILNTVNPDLLKLKVISITMLQEIKLPTVICCDPATGESKLNIIEKDGKKYYMDGDKKDQEFTGCPESNEECEGTEKCIPYQLNQYEGKFMCSTSDNVCCSCSNKKINGTITYKTCRENISADECDKWCASLENTTTRGTEKWPGKYTCIGTDTWRSCIKPN